MSFSANMEVRLGLAFDETFLAGLYFELYYWTTVSFRSGSTSVTASLYHLFVLIIVLIIST